MREILVDVRGATLSDPEIACDVDGCRYRFVADARLKPGLRFHVGAFFSKAVASDEVFNYPRRARIAVLSESPIDASHREIPRLLRRFPRVFTHQQHLLDRGSPFAPLFFGTNWLGATDRATTTQVLEERPEKSRQVSFIGSLLHPDTGAYRLRREIAEYAVSRGDVDCFGRGIREIAGKREALADYRFSVAMENARADHYFTEKLIDCLLLETVPIYYGWPSVGEWLDPRGLLTFESREELARVLDRLTPELYESMRPFVRANKEKVVAAGWHSHRGMLERLSAQLPANIAVDGGHAAGEAGNLQRALRALSSRLGFAT